MGSWLPFCRHCTWFTTSASIKWCFPTFWGLRKTTTCTSTKWVFVFIIKLLEGKFQHYLKGEFHHYKMSFGFYMFLSSSYLKGTPRRYKMNIGFLHVFTRFFFGVTGGKHATPTKWVVEMIGVSACPHHLLHTTHHIFFPWPTSPAPSGSNSHPRKEKILERSFKYVGQVKRIS